MGSIGPGGVTVEPELSDIHRTAVGVAAIRAVHLLRDGEPKIFEDTYALGLTGWSEAQAVAMADHAEARLSSMYTTWICRGRFAEDRLEIARRRGVHQYVVLGAGLDSFALRHADRLDDLLVYEVDDPPMQAWKQWRLAELRVAPPETLRVVPCNFETQALRDALAVGGFDVQAPAFVSWLGVTQYLTPSAIAETLRWAASLADGSEILIAYLVPSPEVDAAKASGMPFESFFRPEAIEAMLDEARLRVEHVTPEDLGRRYFQNREDGLRAPTGERLVIGHVSHKRESTDAGS
jgi:methyltransferase (TIGR00027 family)